MSEVVYKYELNPGWNYLELPGDTSVDNRGCGTAILDVAFQGDTLVMWARVNPADKPRPRMFYCAMTGQPLPEETHRIQSYIGTATDRHGIVVHVFDAYAKDAQ